MNFSRPTFLGQKLYFWVHRFHFECRNYSGNFMSNLKICNDALNQEQDDLVLLITKTALWNSLTLKLLLLVFSNFYWISKEKCCKNDNIYVTCSRIMYRTEAPRRCIIHIRTFRKPFTKFTNLILVPCLVLWEIHNKHYTLCIKSHLGEHYA